MTTKAQRIVFTGKCEVMLETFDPGVPGDREVLVENLVSMISVGTEMTVFNRLFAPDTHWDKWVKYPFYPGYASIGRVTAVGREVTTVKPGDRVAHRSGHASVTRLEASKCFTVPEGLDNDVAAWFAFAKIAAMGLKVAEIAVNTATAVIGGGPIGQMAARWAVAAGGRPVIMIDPSLFRTELARVSGITPLCIAADDAVAEVAAVNGGNPPDVVIDSTGHAQVFACAQKMVKKYGRIVMLGDPGNPGEQRLTSDLITRGLTVVGAHDCHETEEWNREIIVPLFFEFCRSGRFNAGKLITHRFRPEQCAAAYDSLNHDRDKTLGVVFEWQR